MTVLNPPLYAYLKRMCGDVRVTHQGEPLVAKIEVGPDGRKRFVKDGHHEQYNVCCPLCGDTRYRLFISYRWLTDWQGWGRLTHLAYCYNEDCPVRRREFYAPVLKALADTSGMVEVWSAITKPVQARELVPVHMPDKSVALHELAADHPVREFLAAKYVGINADYLGRYYGAVFCAQGDPYYKLVRNRIVFPIYQGGQLVGWQGRTIDLQETKRWILSPGFKKVAYNLDRVPSGQVPIVCEGITSAIACGPAGVALFGKTVDDQTAKALADRFTTCIVLLDPDACVPDTRSRTSPVFADKLCEKLNQYCTRPVRKFEWPPEILDLARRKIAGEDVRVPDPADLGPLTMQAMLSALPSDTLGV